MKQNRWMVFGICAGLFLISQLYRVANAVIAQDLSRDLRLTPKDLGLLSAAFFYVFGLIQIPLGPALDRFGSKQTMVALNLIGVAGGLVFAEAGGLVGGLAGRIMLGLGMSANLMGSLKIYSRSFSPREFATISGLMLSTGTLGSLLATSPLVLLANALDWRGAFRLLALVNLVMTLALAAWVREPAGTAGRSGRRGAGPSGLGAIRVLFSNPNFWSIAITACLRYGVYAAIISLWAGPFFMIHLGFSELTSGNLLLLIHAGFIAGAPFWGLVSDRIIGSRKKTALISMTLSAGGVFILAHWPGPVHLPWLVVLLFLLGFAMPISPVLFTHIKELMPGSMTGTAMTGVNSLTMLGGGLFIHGLGSLLEKSSAGALESGGDYRAAFLFCAGGIFLAVIIYLFSREASEGRRPDPAK